MIKFTKAAAISTVAGLVGLVAIAATSINRNPQEQAQYRVEAPFAINNSKDAYNFAGKGLLAGSLISLAYLGLRGQIKDK